MTSIFASSSYYNPATRAFDLNPATYWLSGSTYGGTRPVWWEIDFASPQWITHVEIDWSSLSYAAADYEIQAWSPNGWVSKAQLTQNDVTENVFYFESPFRTEKLRIYVNRPVSSSYYGRVGISEVRISRANLIAETSYQDLNLSDGEYHYTVTAVDQFGFESGPSNEAPAIVGDVTPPSAPLSLTANASGSDVRLQWTANTEADLAGYTVYRHTDQDWIQITASLVTEATYTDPGLANGIYSYRVTAVDAAGSEGEPSNEASATVAVDPPPAPENLRLTAVPEGEALSAAWDDSGTQVSGFRLYRSVTAGGPYQPVNQAPLGENSFTDTGLTNGVSYYYVVSAVDLFGNEGEPSQEATGMPTDTIPPEAPGTHLSSSGTCLSRYADRIELTGYAEPGILVELFQDGVQVDRTTSASEDVTTVVPLDSDSERGAVSPDGRMIAFEENGALWFMDLVTGEKEIALYEAFGPVWSPRGDKIAYYYYDENWNGRIGLYHTETGESIPFTDGGNDVYEESPSWSQDGTKIAFVRYLGGVYALWVKDLALGTLTEIPGTGNAYNPQLSPNGRQVAFTDYPFVHVVDLESHERILVDDQSDEQVLRWSPESRWLAYDSQMDGSPDLYVWDASTGNSLQLTDTDEREHRLAWSPDGRHLVYAQDEGGGRASLWLQAVDLNGVGAKLADDLSYVWALFYTTDGRVGYIQNRSLTVLELAGAFRFDDVPLLPGNNRFYLKGTDSAGNESVASDEICVSYDTSQSPDLSVTAADIFLYPPFPIAGEEMLIDVAVSNHGSVSAEDVEIDIYLFDAAGHVDRLKSDTIPLVGPNAGEFITMTFDTTGIEGAASIYVVLDGNDRIQEADETNNIAYRDFQVSLQEGVNLTTSLEKDQFGSHEDVRVTLDLVNSGVERDVSVEVWVEDAAGVPVALLDHFDVTLPYGVQERFDYTWNTGVTYAGAYQVHATLNDPPRLAEDQLLPFEILPTLALGSSVTTDKGAYGPHENISLRLSTVNDGDNYVLPSLMTTVNITDWEDNVVFSEEKPVINLQPELPVSWSAKWNTGLYLPGIYEVALAVLLDGAVVSDSVATFEVEAVAVPFGDLAPSPTSPVYGTPLHVAYSVRNVGNAGVDPLPLDVVILDAETRAPVSHYSESIALATGGTHAGEVVFATDGYGLKTYLAELQVLIDGSIKTLATRSLVVRDGDAPVLEIVSPLSGGIYRGEVGLSLTAADDLSGVARVEYRIDGGEWRLLPMADYTAGRYASTWVPSASDDGDHDISYRAVDTAGNVSIPRVATITIITNSPPVTVADAFGVDEDQMLQVPAAGLLSNDTDPDVDPLTVHLGTAANHGALTLNPDGSFTYMPNQNWHGTDHFTYRAHDGEAWSEEAAVEITVASVNDAPVARDNTHSTDEDQTLDVALPTILGNDSDVDSESLTATLVSDVTDGILTLDPDGSFVYTPAENWFGTDSFTYKANDGALVSNVATVTITVDAVNDAPVAVNDEGFAVDEDHTLTLLPATLLANDSDIEGDTLTVLLESNATHGTVMLNDDGSLSYTPEPDWNGTDSFTYQASDGAAISDPATVGITVHAVNDAPVAQVATYSTDEDVTLNVTVPGLLGHATDVEGDVLTIALVDSAMHGVVTLNGDGSFSYVPNPDWNGTDSFSFTANDGELDSEAAVVTLTVNPVNDAPWISLAPEAQTVQYSDGVERVTVTAGDIDSASLTITAAGLPPDLSVSGEECASVNGVLTCNWSIDGQVRTGAAIHDIAVTVSDGELQAETQMALTVEQENARVDFHDDNPVSVRVAQDGGNSDPFSVTALIREVMPDLTNGPQAYAGEISLSDISMSLIPVGPGGSVSPVSCSEAAAGAGYDGVVMMTCTFSDVEVNTYTLTVLVAGEFYAGIGEDVLVVNDPSLGKATGGGWFYWPGTENVESGYAGDKTNFGFTMSYKKNGGNVKGKLLLIRHLPDGTIYRVKSNALYGMALGVAEDVDGLFGWASFSGKSTYMEPGWLEPVGNHEFVVYLEDHDEPGNGHDRFWVEIHDKDGSLIPHMSMDREAVDNTVELGGGNVVAPH